MKGRCEGATLGHRQPGTPGEQRRESCAGLLVSWGSAATAPSPTAPSAAASKKAMGRIEHGGWCRTARPAVVTLVGVQPHRGTTLPLINNLNSDPTCRPRTLPQFPRPVRGLRPAAVENATAAYMLNTPFGRRRTPQPTRRPAAWWDSLLSSSGEEAVAVPDVVMTSPADDGQSVHQHRPRPVRAEKPRLARRTHRTARRSCGKHMDTAGTRSDKPEGARTKIGCSTSGGRPGSSRSISPAEDVGC